MLSFFTPRDGQSINHDKYNHKRGGLQITPVERGREGERERLGLRGERERGDGTER